MSTTSPAAPAPGMSAATATATNRTSSGAGREALEAVLAQAKAEGRAALMGYLPVGYPTVPESPEAMRTLVEGGCDVVEVGFPLQRSGARRPGDPGRGVDGDGQRRYGSPTSSRPPARLWRRAALPW